MHRGVNTYYAISTSFNNDSIFFSYINTRTNVTCKLLFLSTTIITTNTYDLNNLQ